MKKVRPDGTVWYYYHKKKVGRPKKRGPKKKPKKRGRSWQEPWDYKIIQFDFKKQQRFIGYYHDIEEANYAKKILEERNSEVIFPKRFINNGRNPDKLYEYKSEYVILQKNRDESCDGVTQLRNDFGKLVDHKTTSKKWMIFDKFPCLTEETFWVYGYNPKTDRKTFQWIYDNFIENQIDTSLDMINIYLYNNKVIFRYPEKEINFVICKNISDAIYMYNLIEERTKKIKQVVMTGATSGKNPRAREIIQILKDKTGWNYDKIYQTTTRE